jgi:hypothetical protein
MRTLKGKLLLLLLLLVAWGAIFTLRRPAEPPAAPAGEPRGVRPARTAAAQPDGLPRLKTELLKIARPPYPPEAQSIFGSPPPPPAPPPPVQTAAEVARAAAVAAAQAVPPPDPFQEEARQLRYVGFMRRGGTALAFIVQGQEVHTIPVDGSLGSRFRVREIKEDAVLLASPSGDKLVRLPLNVEAGGVTRR